MKCKHCNQPIVREEGLDRIEWSSMQHFQQCLKCYFDKCNRAQFDARVHDTWGQLLS